MKNNTLIILIKMSKFVKPVSQDTIKLIMELNVLKLYLSLNFMINYIIFNLINYNNSCV